MEPRYLPFKESLNTSHLPGWPGPPSRAMSESLANTAGTWRGPSCSCPSSCPPLFPFYWMAITSIKPNRELYSPKIMPLIVHQPTLKHYADLISQTSFLTWTANTCWWPWSPPRCRWSISRIEALLALHFVSLLVHALLERDVRRAMVRRGIAELPLYPEERDCKADCKAPSRDRILEVFAPLQRHLLSKGARVVQRFDPELTDLQRKLLALLGIAPKVFMNV